MNNYKITFISSQEFDEKIQGTELFKDCKLTKINYYCPLNFYRF